MLSLTAHPVAQPRAALRIPGGVSTQSVGIGFGDLGSAQTLIPASTGATITILGSASATRLYQPLAVAATADTVYVADADVLVAYDRSTQTTSALAGVPAGFDCADGASGPLARWAGANQMVISSDQQYLFAATYCGLRRVDLTTGAVTTIAPGNYTGVAGDSSALYASHADAANCNDSELDVISNAATATVNGATSTLIHKFTHGYTYPCYPYQIKQLALTATGVYGWVFDQSGRIDEQPKLDLVDVATGGATTVLTDVHHAAALTSGNDALFTARDSSLEVHGNNFSTIPGFVRVTSLPGNLTSLSSDGQPEALVVGGGNGSAGTGTGEGSADGIGADAWMSEVTALAYDGTGLVGLDDGRVFGVAPANKSQHVQPSAYSTADTISKGDVRTIAGDGTAATRLGTPGFSQLSNPIGIAVHQGALYVSTDDIIAKVNPATGQVSNALGIPGSPDCHPGRSNLNARARALQMTSDGAYLYAATSCGLLRIDLTFQRAELIAPGVWSALTTGPDNKLYAARVLYQNGQQPAGSAVYEVDADTGQTTLMRAYPTLQANSTVCPSDVTAAAADSQHLWVLVSSYSVCGSSSGSIRIEQYDYATQTWSVFYETPYIPSYPPVLHDQLARYGLTSAGGYLYAVMSETSQARYGISNYRIVSLRKADADLKTVAGGHELSYGDTPPDGAGGSAGFGDVLNLASDGRTLYVADRDFHRVRAILDIHDTQATVGVVYPGEQGVNPAEAGGVCDCAADPVNTVDGSLIENLTDLDVPGRGPGLSLGRSYNSKRAAATTSQTAPGALGFGWTLGYEMHVAENAHTASDGTTVTEVVQENGSVIPFYKHTTGSTITWEPSTRVQATLAHNPDGTWTLVRKHEQTFQFTAAGKLASLSDRNGNTTTLGYSPGGLLTGVTDPAGRSLTLSWAAAGDGLQHLRSVTDPAGRSVTFTVDVRGDLTAVQDAAGSTTAYQYNSRHQLTDVTLPSGEHTHTAYQPVTGRIASQTDAGGRTTSFAYTDGLSVGDITTDVTSPTGAVTHSEYTAGRRTKTTWGYGTALANSVTYEYDPVTGAITTMTDQLGRITKAVYNADGTMSSETDADNRSSTITYNASGDIASIGGPDGTTNTVTRDVAGNILSSTVPVTGTAGSSTVPAAVTSSRTTVFHHDDPSHPEDVTSVTDPAGKTWTYQQDAAGNVTSQTDPLGNKSTATYGPDGRLLTVTSPKGNLPGAVAGSYTTVLAYNGAGQVTRVTDPLGHHSDYSYDADHRLLSVTDPVGKTSTFEYGPDGQPTVTHLPDGTTRKVAYDTYGRVSSQVDGLNQNVLTFGYDLLERVTSSTDALGRATTASYDLTGRLVSTTDPRGVKTSVTFDPAGQTTGVTYTGASGGALPAGVAATHSLTFGYDQLGRRTSMTDGTGTSQYRYDLAGQLTSTTEGTGHTVSYGYSSRGEITTIGYPTASGGSTLSPGSTTALTVTRTLDAAGRLTAVADGLGHTTGFGYDADSQLTGITFPNGVTTTAGYDQAGQLQGC